jgi:hypothetical protein
VGLSITTGPDSRISLTRKEGTILGPGNDTKPQEKKKDAHHSTPQHIKAHHATYITLDSVE